MKPVRDDFLVFGSPLIGDEEINEVVDSMESGWLGTGPKTARFEAMFADLKGIKQSQVAAVNSCTAALHVSMIAAGIQPGDEVITTPLTFCATINAIIHSGARPVLADVDPDTMNIDPDRIEEAVTEKTRAVVPVHFAGRPCEMDRILDAAEKHNLKVIEDCAHAIETEYKGKKAGTFGDFGCFSFYVTKNVVTGEGGMIAARDDDHIARAKMLALHGMSRDAWRRFSDDGYKHYYVVECGFKYNMMDLQAAIGIHQLEKVEINLGRRQEIWNRYQKAFVDVPVVTPGPVPDDQRHACHLYTILLNKEACGVGRDEFLEKILTHNIGVGVHYLSIPEHPFYRDNYGWQPEDYPNAMKIGRETVSLPLSPKLTDRDADDVIQAVKMILKY